MEESRDLNNPVESVAPDEMVPGFVAAESKIKNETAEQTRTEETTSPTGKESVDTGNSKKESGCGNKRKCCIGHLIFDGVLLLAVIALFILHFCDNRTPVSAVETNPAKPGNGDVIYVNIDTINEKYEMVSLLTDSIDAEKQKQTVLFQNRQKALETKLANYQRNMQSGQLTPQQAQYAEQSLQQESAQLQSDYSAALESLEARYTAALSQIADSLKAACQRANGRHNASYVVSYGAGGQVICADPTKDITQEVLDDLNKPFKKKKKGGK